MAPRLKLLSNGVPFTFQTERSARTVYYVLLWTPNVEVEWVTDEAATPS